MQTPVSHPDPSCMAGEEQPGPEGSRDVALSPVCLRTSATNPISLEQVGCGQSALSAGVRCCSAGRGVNALLSVEEAFPFLSLLTFMIIQAVDPVHLLGGFTTGAAKSVPTTHRP